MIRVPSAPDAPPRGRRPRARRLVAGAAVVLTVALVGPVARAATDPSGPSWSPQAATYGVGSLLNQPVTAKDGTVLRADVYYPTDRTSGRAAEGGFPVLLQQTPYGKEAFGGGTTSVTNTDVDYLVQRGYIVVISDVRGTGASGGTFGLFDPVQASDGAAVVDWSARLPHSDGKVGLFGESYMGIDQFLTVSALPRSSPVKAMFPIISGNDIYSDSVAEGGIPDVEFSAFYLALVGGLNAANPLLEPLDESGQGGGAAPLSSGLSNLVPLEVAHDQALASFDLPTLESVETGGNQGFDGPYWQERSPATYLSDVVADRIPAFLVGGWNDLFQQGEPLNYVALQNLYAGRPAADPMAPGQPATPRYQLMMGPWEHVTTGSGVNLAAVELEWFDTWLLGQNTPLAHTTTPLHLEQKQAGRWVDTADWPLSQTSVDRFYLGSGRSGSAPASTNDGTLSAQAPTSAGASDTVAWTGLTSPCSKTTDQWAAGALALGAAELNTTDPCDNDDSSLEAGPGALTYTTAPLSSPEVVGGPIDATLYATSTTADTEFVTTVEEVSPTGESLPLTSGALLGSLRKLDPARTWADPSGRLTMPIHAYTQSSAEPVVPGKVTRYDIEIFPTFAEIPAGWRLRVTITTGDTPHLEPTPVQASRLLGGVYEVQRNAGWASYIDVPMAPPSAFAVACGAICSPSGP